VQCGAREGRAVRGESVSLGDGENGEKPSMLDLVVFSKSSTGRASRKEEETKPPASLARHIAAAAQDALAKAETGPSVSLEALGTAYSASREEVESVAGLYAMGTIERVTHTRDKPTTPASASTQERPCGSFQFPHPPRVTEIRLPATVVTDLDGETLTAENLSFFAVREGTAASFRMSPHPELRVRLLYLLRQADPELDVIEAKRLVTEQNRTTDGDVGVAAGRAAAAAAAASTADTAGLHTHPAGAGGTAMALALIDGASAAASGGATTTALALVDGASAAASLVVVSSAADIPEFKHPAWMGLGNFQSVGAKGARSTLHPERPSKAISIDATGCLQVYFECHAPGFRYRRFNDTTDPVGLCLAGVRVTITTEDIPFTTHDNAALASSSSAPRPAIKVEVLEPCIHRAAPCTKALYTSKETPEAEAFVQLKGVKGFLMQQQKAASVSAAAGKGGDAPLLVHSRALTLISKVGKLCGNLGRAGGTDTGQARKGKMVARTESRPGVLTEACKQETMANFEAAARSRQESTYIRRYDPMNHLYCMYDRARLEMFKRFVCGNNLLTTRGAVVDTTMKVVRGPKIPGGESANLPGNFSKLRNTIVLIPSQGSGTAPLDAFEIIHLKGTSKVLTDGLSSCILDVAELSPERLPTAFVTDQDFALSDALCRAAAGWRFLDTEDRRVGEISLESELKRRLGEFAIPTDKWLKDVMVGVLRIRRAAAAVAPAAAARAPTPVTAAPAATGAGVTASTVLGDASAAEVTSVAAAGESTAGATNAGATSAAAVGAASAVEIAQTTAGAASTTAAVGAAREGLACSDQVPPLLPLTTPSLLSVLQAERGRVRFQADSDDDIHTDDLCCLVEDVEKGEMVLVAREGIVAEVEAAIAAAAQELGEDGADLLLTGLRALRDTVGLRFGTKLIFDQLTAVGTAFRYGPLSLPLTCMIVNTNLEL